MKRICQDQASIAFSFPNPFPSWLLSALWHHISAPTSQTTGCFSNRHPTIKQHAGTHWPLHVFLKFRTFDGCESMLCERERGYSDFLKLYFADVPPSNICRNLGIFLRELPWTLLIIFYSQLFSLSVTGTIKSYSCYTDETTV